MSKHRDDGCQINITIHSEGDVNIYNCTHGADTKAPCDDKPCDSLPPGGPGACVPLAIGSKPKQSQRQKLDNFLNRNPVPSALAAGFLQLARRFVAGRAPANPFEQAMFDRLRDFDPGSRRTLECALGQYAALPVGDREALFDTTLTGSIDTPVDPKSIASRFLAELQQRATTLAPEATSPCSCAIKRSTSAGCSPVVGSSSTYRVPARCARCSSVASLMRCASPPESSVAGWPSFAYPSPTSRSAPSARWTGASSPKNSQAASTVMPSTWAMFLPRYSIASVLSL